MINSLPIAEFIRKMPKVELHVHLEGSIRPQTLLILAKRHAITLPAQNLEELREWYRFSTFDHFVQIYRVISTCIQTPADLELITREFLTAQAEQNILYSEVTYTPFGRYTRNGLAFESQLAAINRARAWGKQTLGIDMALITDIDRETSPEEGNMVADWAIAGKGNGVVALGLGGAEVGNPPEKFRVAFDRAAAAGVPSIPHAGETGGADSIRGALTTLRAVRIGHGVRCLEDPKLVSILRDRQIMLEVCPGSNVCLGVAPSLKEHPLPRLIAEGLNVSINSDDPPMFNTTLTQEYQNAAEAFGFDRDMLKKLVLNAAKATLLPDAEKAVLLARVNADFARLLDPATGRDPATAMLKRPPALPTGPAFKITPLSDALYMIKWYRMASSDDAHLFIETLKALLDGVPHPIAFLSDLRGGAIDNGYYIKKLAALTAHKNWDTGTAFGTLRAQIYADFFSQLARPFKRSKDSWSTLQQAVDFLEEQHPGLTKGINWNTLKD